MNTDNTAVQTIELELGDGRTLAFEVNREHYIAFVNMANKNSFNAMNNLLAASVTDDSRELLTELQKNPANVTELAGEVIQDYKPDVSVAVKKRNK